MRTGRRNAFFALFALVMCGALMIFGCDPDTPSGSITFTVTANTPSSDKNTESLDIKFSSAVTGLTLDNISLTSTQVQKDSLTANGQSSYTLGITVKSPYAGPVTCMVRVNKDGVSSADVSINGDVVNNVSPADYNVTNSTKVDASGAAELTITLTKAVALTAADITITNGSGTATKGALTGSDKVWTLKVTGAKAGEIKVKIGNSQVNDAEKTVTLSDDTTTEGDGGGSGPIISITLDDINPTYSKLVGTNQVEIGAPKQLSWFITPQDMQKTPLTWISLDTSEITVDSKGIVTAANSASGKKTTVVARSPDDSIGGTIELTAVKRIIPDKLTVTIPKTDYWMNSTDMTVTSTDTSSSTVKIKRGDNLKLTTVLEKKDTDSTYKRTNDQTITIPSLSTSSFTITDSGKDDGKTDDVPGHVYDLKTTGATTSVVPVTISANYNRDVKVTLNIQVTYTPIQESDIKVNYLKSDGNWGTWDDTSTPKFSETVKTITMIIVSSVPNNDISLVASNNEFAKWIEIKEDTTKKAANYRVYTLTPKKDWTYPASVEVTATVTDIANAKETKLITVTYE